MPIVQSATFNPNSLTADDLYIQIQNPPGFISGVPTDVFGVVGTASWGPVNIPVNLPTPFAALQAFGAIGAAALTDAHDLATDLAIAFGQSTSAGSAEAWAVRVTDGTDVAASGAMAGVVADSETATWSGSITNGDSEVITITSSALTGSPIHLTIPVVTADTTTTLAAKLAAAINSNAVLAAAGFFASSLVAVTTIYYPSTLSPAPVFSKTDGSSIVATLASGSTTTAGATLNAIFTGIIGNGLTATVSAGSATNTWSVALALPVLGISELYPNLPQTGFWAAFASAVANGLSGVRGPSQIAKVTNVNSAVGAPTAGTSTVSGGTDGRSGVTTSNLVGSNSAIPNTGMWALSNLSPAIGVAWLVGVTDTTAWSALLSFGQTQGASMLAAFAAGTSTATAVAAVATNGIHDPSFAYVKDWCYFFDPINNVQRLVPPYAYIGGFAVTLTPAQSPANKQLPFPPLGTERNNPQTGNIPYGDTEVGQLASAGIMFITNPCPAGSIFGIREAQTTSLNGATAPFEWWRMTNFLARSFLGNLGQYVGQLQSQQPNDPLRNAVKLSINTFLQSLVGGNGVTGQIDSFSVICSFSSAQGAVPGNGVNTPASVAQHYMYVLVRVTYLSTVRFFILSLQGGTTVVSVGATPGQQLAA